MAEASKPTAADLACRKALHRSDIEASERVLALLADDGDDAAGPSQLLNQSSSTRAMQSTI